MPRKNTLQTDFLAGEISPRMEMREDLEGRKHSLEFVQNWYIHLQGTAETTRGYEFVTDIPATFGRIFPFQVSLNTEFVVVVTPDLIYITDSAGLVKEDSLLINGDFDEGALGWSVTTVAEASVVFIAGSVILSGGSAVGKFASITQEATVVIGNSNSLTIQVIDGIDVMNINVGSAEGLSDIYSDTITSETVVTIEDLISTTTSMWIELLVPGDTSPKTLNDVQLYDVTASSDIVSFPSVWSSESEIEFIQAMMSPNELALYLVSPTAAPFSITYDTTTSTWTFETIAFTNPPGEWSDIDGWPSAIGFFGGRMWLGGVLGDPALFWGSKPASYFDFTTGELADDAIEHRLNRRGAIRWIVGGQSLLIGTENAEHVVSASGGVLIPGDIQATVQSTHGSYPAQALEVGNEVMYISSDGRKIWGIQYAWDQDAWRSKDLTYASEHITRDNQLTHLCYAPNPFSLIIGTTKNGTFVYCTYEPFSGTAGFSRRITEGEIIDGTVLTSAGTSEVWVLVYRGIEGVLSLERTFQERNIKLDSHTHFNFDVPTSEIAIPRLAGRTCQVLVDGAVHPDVVPSVPDGEVTLEFSGVEIIIGLLIDSKLVTLPVADTIANVGTTRSMKKRFHEIWVRVLDSWRPKINGQRTPNRRVATPMGEIEPARTESVRISNKGWDIEAKITIEQDLPLPTEIVGIFGRIEQEEV